MKKLTLTALTIVLIGIIFLGYMFYELFIPVSNFPLNTIYTVNGDMSGNEIFQDLYDKGYIRSVFWAKVAGKLIHKNKYYRGDYGFQAKQSTFQIVHSLTTRPPSLAVLIPEGFTKEQVADRLAKYIVRFNRSDFLKKAQEGYLYPETYYFFSFSTNDEILKEFSDKFNQEMLTNFGRLPSKSEIIIASMLEREAKDPNDMKLIAGIIQNRLKIGMPLQIDATVLYGKGAWQERVFYADLKHQNDYNTYVNKGLPIGPISNPGLNAIRAAMSPAKTKYMYYLTGTDGKMYYAEDFETHVKNKAKYIR